MGMPVDELPVECFSNKDCRSQKLSACMCEELRCMGGNGMSVRAIMVAMCVLLRAMNPCAVQSYLQQPH